MYKKGIISFLSVLTVFIFLRTNDTYAGDRQPAGDHLRYGDGEAGAGNLNLLTDHAYYNSLMQDLSRAEQNIVIIMYLFKATGHRSALPDHIVDMLLKEHKQGLDVTVILNIDQKNNLYKRADDLDEANLSVAKRLEHGGIKVYFDSPRRITHAKVVIIDKRIVYIGSHNFTQSALKYNHEVSVRVVSPAFAEELARYVDELRQER
jgi:phosphatidylserine/phosphatidylglycerophosphate/cardiolipin synthase-like enzyme